MRVVNYGITAVVFAALCGPARAQTPVPQTVPVPQGVTAPDSAGLTEGHWTASGFIGSSFGNMADEAFGDNTGGIDFGGQVAYIWRGMFGPELLVNFAPDVSFDRDVKLSNVNLFDNPRINSYMANAIAALPLGFEGRIQPYVSGGYGAVQMKTNVLEEVELVDGTLDTSTTSHSNFKLGSNIGGGIMAFAGKIGIRADLRYFHTSNPPPDPADPPAEQLSDALVSGLNFWRANAGIAFVW
jgi:opacity protein-like surface antigen